MWPSDMCWLAWYRNVISKCSSKNGEGETVPERVSKCVCLSSSSLQFELLLILLSGRARTHTHIHHWYIPLKERPRCYWHCVHIWHWSAIAALGHRVCNWRLYNTTRLAFIIFYKPIVFSFQCFLLAIVSPPSPPIPLSLFRPWFYRMWFFAIYVVTEAHTLSNCFTIFKDLQHSEWSK